MPLSAGSRLGVYDIIAKLGEGGMGQVFRARDTRLNRDVALKVLPDAFATDPDRLARFAREAQTLASLNHSNIAHIHGLEESGGVSALVMELVEGEDLSQRIARGPVPLAEALPIAKQIAEALEAAHGQGIVHRDLKPANIKVRPDGTVKVLDFGLAKAIEPKADIPSGSAMSPTITTPPHLGQGYGGQAMTQAGFILGTAAYMPPEQAKGQPADIRSDIWAFGCVVYEMLVGKPAFAAETVAEIHSAILTSDPDWQSLPQAAPAAVRFLLNRCLQKDRARRMRDIADARFQIEEALNEPAVRVAPASRPQRSRERFAWMAVTIVLAGALGLRVAATLNAPDAPEMRLTIPTEAGSILSEFVLSPDGRTLVYQSTAEGQLRLRRLDGDTAQTLAGTDGASFPFWSPDNRSVAFFAGGQLKRIDLSSGLVQQLADAPLNTRGGAWNSAGTILFTRSATEPLYRVSASGGKVAAQTELTAPHLGHRFPQFLPDGRHFLFFAYGPPESQGIYAGSLDSKETTRLIDAESAPIFALPDYVMFARHGAVFAQRINLDTLQTVGDPVPVARQVVTPPGAVASVALTASMAGPVAYRADAGERQLRWVDRSGRQTGVVGPSEAGRFGDPSGVRLAPDGRTVAAIRMTSGNNDVWLLETARDVRRRFTSDPAREFDPIWSPDGRRIVFGSTRKGGIDLYMQPVDAGVPESLLWASPESKNAEDWSSDGRWIVFATQNPNTARDLWALPMEGDQKPIVIARTAFEEAYARVSPDGRWIAYHSNESGRNEVYVQAFPQPGGRTQISTGGGSCPQWQRDGKALFYRDAGKRVMSVPVALTASSVEPGIPVALFALSLGAAYHVSPDGQRFLIDEITKEASPITILLNWKPPR